MNVGGMFGTFTERWIRWRKYFNVYTIDDYIEGKVPRGEWLLCPFHEDHRPSGRVMKDTGRFNCYVCGAQGDQIDCAARLWFKKGEWIDNIIMADALIRRNAYPLVTEMKPKAKKPVSQDVLAYLTEWCHRCNDHLKRNPDVIERIQKGRSLKDPVGLGLGLASYQLFREFRKDYPDEDLALQCSLIREGDGHPLRRYKLSDRIIIPEYRNKKSIYYIGRAQGTAGLRYLCPDAQYGLTKPVMGWDTLQRDRPYVWIVEGPFDMLPLIEAGEAVISTGGLSLNEDAATDLVQALAGRKVIIGYDNDKINEQGFKPGLVGARKILAKLHAREVRAAILTPPVKDIGEWVTTKGIEEVLGEAKSFVSWY